MPLGATSHTPVSWTSGDTITEVKLDAMTGNDNAFDSHASNGILLNNNTGFYQKDTGGTNREVVNLSDGNILKVGHSAISRSMAGKYNGWDEISDSFAYASATTITVPTGATDYYSVGDKLRLKQGGGYKYYYIVAVASTLLTVTGGSDYTVANSAITDVAIAKGNAVGFPGGFSFTPTWTAASTNPVLGNGTFLARFCMNGKMVSADYYLKMGSTTTYGTGYWLVSIPVTIAGSGDATKQYGHGNFQTIDATVGGSYGSASAYAISTTQIVFDSHTAKANFNVTAPFTWATDDQFYGRFTYEAA